MIKKERKKEQDISIFSGGFLNFYTIKVVLSERNTLKHEFPTDRKFFVCFSCSQILYFLLDIVTRAYVNKNQGGFVDRWLVDGKQPLCTGYPILGERNHRK